MKRETSILLAVSACVLWTASYAASTNATFDPRIHGNGEWFLLFSLLTFAGAAVATAAVIIGAIINWQE